MSDLMWIDIFAVGVLVAVSFALGCSAGYHFRHYYDNRECYTKTVRVDDD